MRVRYGVRRRGETIAVVQSLVIMVASVVFTCTASAQGAVSARDPQSHCLLNSLPNAERLTVSWTGDCIGGLANGVGDVIAFSGGQLRYILRGQFRAGDLIRQDNVRDCAGASAKACRDDVPPSLLRLHEQAAAGAAVSPSGNTASPALGTSTDAAGASPVPPPAPSAAGTAVLNEVQAVDGIYRGKITLDPVTRAISGEVRASYNDGRRFEGTMRDGRKEGVGTYVWPDGLRYSGHWKNDQQDGEGTLTFANGDVYEGDFVKGDRTGKGVLRYKNGGSYRGEWLGGARSGHGVEEWPNGQRYDGSWKDNRKDGSGSMRFANGDTYEGDWRDDRASGKGDIVFASGDSYAGEVRDGVPQGQGIMRWGSGDRFEGEFDSGKPTKRGVMTFLAEEVAANQAAAASQTPAPTPVPGPTPAPAASGDGTAVPAAPSRAELCAVAFNTAHNIAALRRFLDSFPDDECNRHGLAREKIAAWEEQARAAARAASKALEERQANARGFVGSTVAFRQEFPFCVTGSGASCQRVVYVFDVKAKVRDIDVQKGRAQVQISEVTSLGNEKGAAPQWFAQGRGAATSEFRSRWIGATVSKTFAEIGLVGL